MAKCRSCDASILWATTTDGNLIPVDEQPTENGNVELVETVSGTRAIVHAQPSLLLGELRLPHFATCPQADSWRKK